MKKNYRIYRQMITSFFEENQKEDQIYIQEGKIELKPVFYYDEYENIAKVEFKIGDGKKFYRIKNLVQFYDRMLETATYEYEEEFSVIHTRKSFSDDSKPLLDFLMKNADAIKLSAEAIKNNYYGNNISLETIRLSPIAIDEFFELLNGKEAEYKNLDTNFNEEDESRRVKTVKFVDDEPDIKFTFMERSKTEYAMLMPKNYEFKIIYGRKFVYIFREDTIYRASREFEKTVIKIINIYSKNLTEIIELKKSEFSDFYSVVYPKLKKHIDLDCIKSLDMNEYLPRSLKSKVYLDYNKKNYVLAKIIFGYDELEINPFEEQDENIPRNSIEETMLLDIFQKYEFMYDQENAGLILTEDEKIYNFLKYGINELVERAEVLATETFKKRQIITPKLNSMTVKVENNMLEIGLSNMGVTTAELEEIMKKYNLKKRFFRLKNGEFLELENNKSLETIKNIAETTELNYRELLSDQIQLPLHRSLYLDKILKKNEITIKGNEEYEKFLNNITSRDISDKYELPKGLNASLREYQQVGYKWLRTLDDYNLGGILADDMGLGKTVQVIALILNYVETYKSKRKTSLVVCPSSLTLNWNEEIKKFAPKLKTLIISGTAEERAKLLEKIPSEKYDVVITSYDILKRDIDIHVEQQYLYKYLIADEAQYVKNNITKNARAIKKIKADTRFALTGTPIENSLSELWSIFDLIMPGYLYTYSKFKANYEIPIIKEENQYCFAKLKQMIEPFVLRRLKEKVLTELPEKTITILNNEMEGEQKEIYQAYLKNAQKEAKEEIQANGAMRSQIKILALLMRLRQICCHPALFIENYEDESSKLNQCIEIIKDGISSGRRILLFSGYSSMFGLIEKELVKLNIKYFKLTGQTKVNDRLDLVNEFNANEEIKVFLISLKAGGTGLNLTGADMVIHYDPWWNLSAENQATDRTYRIGQKKNVQVYKLITKNSIEEKIFRLQEKKAKLADDMFSNNETFISKLSNDEIMDLFRE